MSHSILVIEDDSDIREIVVKALEMSDYQVWSAPNGKIGIESAKERVPDLIISDIMMPEADGYDVLQALRKHEPTSLVPFLFMSAKSDNSDIREGMNLGADDYITKPFDIQELLQTVSARLHKHKSVEQYSNAKADKLRSDLSYILPHEFLTPLNSLLGISSMLVNASFQFSPEELHEMHTLIHTSARRLHRLAENFLMFASLEMVASDPMRMSIMQSTVLTGVKHIIEEAVFRQIHAAHRVGDLRIQIIDAELYISELNLSKIIDEIVSNACAFSNPGSGIEVFGFPEDELYCILIKDFGRGMTQEQVKNIGAYTQFERRTYEQQGGGLGVAIARRIAEMYRGSLTIESKQNAFTTVRIYLPLRKA